MALSCASGSALESSICKLSKKSADVAFIVKPLQLSSSFTGERSVSISRKQVLEKFKIQKVSAVSASVDNEVYEVELDKPYGLKFYKGKDGGVYIDAVAINSSASKAGVVTEGDKVLATSAVFGDEMWPAAEYGRTMYTVKNRVGPLIVKLEKKNGVRIEPAGAKDAYILERNAGNYGDAIREKQIENYLKKKEYEEQRSSELSTGLELYKEGKYNEALERFTIIFALQPSDRERAVTGYNMACCYSKLNEIDKGLAALEAAMEAGFEDYKTIRTDPDLEVLRTSEKFVPLLNQFDEPFINENAMKAISSMFGFFGKK